MTKFASVFRVLTALGVLLALSLAPAEASTGGKIAGVIEDAATGDGLPHANIVVVDTKLGATADEKGRFFILNVPAGTYTLKATYIGYADYTVEDVRVSADLTTNIAVELTSSDIQVEEVVIRAERPIIDKTATNAVRIIDAEDLDILPLRGVSSVISLQTGVVEDEGSLHIRGSRSDEIGYYVEGASVRNVVTGSSAVGLIDEALEEIQLQAGGFNAEYGGANAGIILQELRTGGSEWDFEILSESDNFTDDYEQRFGTYSYGYSNQVMTAGGPVAGSQKIRAFLAGQRSSIGSLPVTGRVLPLRISKTPVSAVDAGTGARTKMAISFPTRSSSSKSSPAIFRTRVVKRSFSTGPYCSTTTPSKSASRTCTRTRVVKATERPSAMFLTPGVWASMKRPPT